jgi:hypothetical protein
MRGCCLREHDPVVREGPIMMALYGFEVKLAAAVRVRAADEALAWKVVRSVVGSRGNSELRAARRRFELELEELANENDTVKDVDAIVTDVSFLLTRSPMLFEINGKRVKRRGSRRS